MEAADDDRDSCFPKRSCDVKGAGILVRLNTDEPNHAEIIVTPNAGDERRHVNARVGLVDSHNIDGDVRSKNLAVSAIGRNTVYGGKRIRGNHRSPPADHISIVIVM
jgi:hypothetical protein